MNAIQLLREAGPEAPALSTDTRNAARAALMAEIDAAARPHRVRLPSRKVRRRVAIGGVAVAASWAAAVVIAAPDGPRTPADSVRLVAFAPPTFPLSLDPLPAGWDVSFSADPGGVLHAAYGDDASDDGLYVRVSPEEPGQYEVTDTIDVTVAGKDAELVEGAQDGLHLVWERQDDQWVQLAGYGSWEDADRLVDAAEHLVDRPQAVPLQISVAPEGWSVEGYKDDRILSLANPDFEAQSLSLHVPLPDEVLPADQVRGSIAGPIGPQLDVTVNDRPAQLVRVEGDLLVDGHFLEGWYLQAQFADGTTFVVQAPGAFTQEQVLQLAASATWNP